MKNKTKLLARAWLPPALAATVALGAAVAGHAQAPADPYNYARTGASSFYGASDGIKRGRLKTVTVEPDNPQLCSVTSYNYDAYGNTTSTSVANCSGATGRALFPVGSGANSAAYNTSTSLSVTVGTGTATVSVAAGLFPTSATNAAGFTETRSYDPRFGAMLALTGPNQLTTTWRYDDFGRATQEQRADGTRTVTAYCLLSGDTTSNSSTTNGDPLSCPTPPAGEAPSDAVMFVHSVALDTAGNALGSYQRVYSDRFGRAIRSVSLSFDGSAQPAARSGVPVYVDTVYNTYGVKEYQTQAYFAVSSSATVTGSNDIGVSRTIVDVLGRPVTVYTSDPNGAGGTQAMGAYGNRTVAVTSFSYSAGKAITTNDKGQTRTEETNVIGELVRVTDTTGATLIHQRDAFGNLVKTRDALGNTTTLVYDLRGRKTQLQDPDAGTWNYDYDALGQLVWQQSPKQKAATPTATQTTMVYDVLGRMTSRTEPEYVSTWRYDKNADGSSCMNGNASQGKGKLCQSGTSNGLSRQFTYDGLGRPSTSLSSATGTAAFWSQVTYDATTGRVATQTYPSGLKVGYSYTTRGWQEKLTLLTATTVNPRPNAQGVTAPSANLPAGTVLWQAQSVGAWGTAEQQVFGNGVTSRTAYQSGTGRVTGLTAGKLDASGNMPAVSGRVISQSYAWDSLSNLGSRIDDIGDGTGAVNETFTYADGLNRLTNYSVSGPGIPAQSRSVTLQYNALGMLLYKSDVGNYTYNAQGGGAGSKPHAVQSITGAAANSFQFDANGNLTSATSGKYRSVSYTSFNLPDSGSGLQGPAGSPKYTWLYDENHARLKETRVNASGTRVTWYLHPNNAGGLAFEAEVAPNGSVSLRHYLNAGGQAIGVLAVNGALPQGMPNPMPSSLSANKLEYWHKDHLGSLIGTTDHTGAVTALYSYDPFGKRRYTSGSYDAAGNVQADWNTTTNAGTDRGYTGHEHLDDVGIVHMNGRLFDPTLGVFMQPDKHVQNAGDLQNFNRYGYCLNNPLTCTDPTGMTYMRPGALSAASRVGSLMVAPPPGAAQKYASATAADASGATAKQLAQSSSSSQQGVSGVFNNPEDAIKWTLANCETMGPQECSSRLSAYSGWMDARAQAGRTSAAMDAASQANWAKMAAYNQMGFESFNALAAVRAADKAREEREAAQTAASALQSGGGIDPTLPPDAALTEGAVALKGLKVVNGRLTGMLYVSCADCSDSQKSLLMEGLSQASAINGFDIEFSLIGQLPPRSGIEVILRPGTGANWEQYSLMDAKTNASVPSSAWGKLTIGEGSLERDPYVIEHEFGHALGLGHSNQIYGMTIMHPVGIPGEPMRQFSPVERQNILNLYPGPSWWELWKSK